jgi:hypothetical protein
MRAELAGCGCFLPYLFVCTAGRSLGAAGARPFSTVSAHRANARLIENRALRYGSSALQIWHIFTTSSSAQIDMA